LALNKRKVLETARKHAQKGAKAKALKEYNKLLKADPRDAKLLLEVGDAYRRWGQAEEAIAQYGKVAQQYRQDGFDARAVAVFKQILNLDPKRYAAYVSLSELYQRMGLDTEAIAALQTAADGYRKEGRKAEALDLLRQTAALDPTNTTSRLKVAELLRQEGMKREAISEYHAVVEELENQGDGEQLLVVLERILEINPDDLNTLTSLTKKLMASGELDRAETFAIRLLNASTEPSQYELLMELYSQGGQEEKLVEATRGLAKLHRDRGDEDAARTLMQRLPVEEVDSSARMAVDVSEVDEPDLADDELLDEEPFLAAEEGPGPDVEPAMAEEPALDLSDAEIELDAELPQPEEPAPLPEGDPDQLLAEANVYLRYGKCGQAIASLRGVLAQEPVHRAALEKLGEAYAADGQDGPAVEAWTQAAAQFREAGDADALAVLKDRVAALDPAAAEQLGSVETVAASDEAESSEVGAELDLDVEVDLDLETAIEEIAGSESQSDISVDLDLDLNLDLDLEDEDEEDASVGASAQDDEEDEFEIELDDDSFGIDADVEVDEVADGDTENEADGVTEPISTTAEDELSLEDDSIEFDVDLDTDGLGGSGSEPKTGVSTTTSAKISEELEEAEFYLAQNMYDEAEKVLSRILKLVPKHPSAMLRMGELAAARGEAPDLDLAATSSSAGTTDASEATLDTTGAGLDDLAGSDGTAEIDVDVDVDVDVEGVTSSEATAEAAEADQGVTEKATPDEIASEDTSPTEVKESEPGGGENFDLREALADVLSDDEELPNGDDTSGVLSTVEDGFGSIFSDFKKGVTATLEAGDYETRYDLGIAYREMGLFEDAIGEFRVCLDCPERQFESLHLMGVCARDLLRFGDAVNHLEQALAMPEIPTERLAGVYFDLALAQQGEGEVERACASLRQTLETDANFPGAAERLAELEAAGDTSPKLASPDNNFESFDELFEADDDDDEDGDEAMIEAVPVETFESFDDVVADAEAIEVEVEAIEDAVELPDEVEEGSSSSASSSSSSVHSDDDTQPAKKGRRKKISFV
jgi:pilus assembly protein FimV